MTETPRRHRVDAGRVLKGEGVSPPGKRTSGDGIESVRIESPPTVYEESFNFSEIHFYESQKGLVWHVKREFFKNMTGKVIVI